MCLNTSVRITSPFIILLAYLCYNNYDTITLSQICNYQISHKIPEKIKNPKYQRKMTNLNSFMIQAGAVGKDGSSELVNLYLLGCCFGFLSTNQSS